MPDCGTISPGLNSCAMVASVANLSTICETEFNQPAFRFTAIGEAAGGGSRGELQQSLGQCDADRDLQRQRHQRGLANLLGWLQEPAADIVCLQELKAPDEKFPTAALRAAGYGAVWHGQKSWNGVAILARGGEPVETRRGLPGDPDDTHRRYIEAAIAGIMVGCLYLPNGNPAPGPRFDYKLRWFERLTDYAQALLDSGAPAVLAGDFNVMPTDLDVYAPERWIDDALFRPEVRDAYRPACTGLDRRAAGPASR